MNKKTLLQLIVHLASTMWVICAFLMIYAFIEGCYINSLVCLVMTLLWLYAFFMFADIQDQMNGGGK